MSIESHFTETFVARLAAREKQIQQHYRPVISVHKWFARRPGALFRALVLAELGDRPVRHTYAQAQDFSGVCLDAFMGGGTPLAEASRVGMSVIGYDTNPMSRWIVERELEDVDPVALAEAGARIADRVERRVGKLYETTCVDCGGDAQARYYLWVRAHRCSCGHETPLLADTKLVSTRLGRHHAEVHVCPCCLRVSEHAPDGRTDSCPHCGESFDENLVPPDTVMACGCGEVWRVPPLGTIETPHHRLVCVDYHCERCSDRARRTFKTADARDQRILRRAERRSAKLASPYLPEELIPRATETERLLRWGYLRWIDLFGARQLLGLGLLAEQIAAEQEGPVKRALQTVFSDLLRYQNMLVRYDRQALKPTDVFALHGFPVPRVSCEAGLLGETGRGSGGFRHILAKYVRAKSWCREPYETVPDAGRLRRVSVVPERLSARLVEDSKDLGESGGAYLRRGSLSASGVREASVDLVLTDPPYYANVQYAELMDFCYAWLRRIAPETAFFDVPHTKTPEDAVGSVVGAGLAEFTERLSSIFCAATKALKPGCVFAFTYHHNELVAYAPVVVSCLDAGLVPTRVYACPSEMRASTHIHGRNASTVDAVFVLRKPPLRAGLAISSNLDIDAHVRARVAALRRAGLKITAADRTCLRNSALTARAIAALTAQWHEMPDGERLSVAGVALGLPAKRTSLPVRA